jgi:hypothetical protein
MAPEEAPRGSREDPGKAEQKYFRHPAQCNSYCNFASSKRGRVARAHAQTLFFSTTSGLNIGHAFAVRAGFSIRRASQ